MVFYRQQRVILPHVRRCFFDSMTPLREGPFNEVVFLALLWPCKDMSLEEYEGFTQNHRVTSAKLLWHPLVMRNP